MTDFFRAQNVLYFLFAAILALFFWSNKAVSESEPPYCRGPWEGTVLGIEASLDPSLRPKNVVLFAGQDGQIFNCLDQDFPQASIEELQFWQMAWSRSISGDQLYENNLPLNFCNSSYAAVGSTKVMVIHLPYEHGEIDDPACLIRTKRLPERVKSFLEEE